MGKRNAGLFFLLALTALLTEGCGYRVGYIGHPQIKSVAVAPVVNETVAYNIAAEVRGLLCERFMTDGTLRLEDIKKADCIVYARVTEIGFSEISWSEAKERDNIYLPNEWKVKLTIEYSVILPGRNEPLLSGRTATGSADFQTGPDMEIGRRNGIRQAAYKAAGAVVSGVTEAW